MSGLSEKFSNYLTGRFNGLAFKVRDVPGDIARAAIHNDQPEVVRLLDKYKDQIADGREKVINEALRWTAKYGHQDMADFLIEQEGADINYQSEYWGVTPLIEAARAEQQDMMKFLERRGANPTLKDREGLTAKDNFEAAKKERAAMANRPDDPDEDDVLRSPRHMANPINVFNPFN